MADLEPSLSEMSPLKLALLAQRSAAQRDLVDFEPIAIIGVGCRFPRGADAPQVFWRNLIDGVDAVQDIPSDRWPAAEHFDPDPAAAGKMYVRHGSFLDAVDGFDPGFFQIAPREAAMMDPQQRLLLEVTWECIERAAVPPAALRFSRTGCFVGSMGSDYARLTTDDLGGIDVHTGTGCLASVAAGRLSYVLGLQGPAFTVDSACSSSLVAVHLACQALRRRECDLSFAGGVNLMLTPHMGVIASRARMLAPDGRCKSFDAAADGMGRGEGCGMILLARLSDAIADGHRVLALIRGSAVNHDGPSSGLTVPNGPSQARVIREALRRGAVDADQVDYVEGHGTGTPLGDPIEATALGEVFGRGRSRPLLIGSVKSNIGHLEGAAGIAGLIKVVLALQHGEIPPNLHFRHPSPHIPWSALPLRVVTERTPWPGAARRIAGVSSFGMSGTNAHVVLEAAPHIGRAETGDSPQGGHLLALSAPEPAALSALADRYARHLDAHPDLDVADICHTAATGRDHFRHRLAVIGRSTGELSTRLAAAADGKSRAGTARGDAGPQPPRVAFLFTGQGAQYAGMGQELYATEPVFREVIDRCDAALRSRLDLPLREVMFPAAKAQGPAPLDRTAYAQPALFALGAALSALWRSWGVEPDVVMGHSIGEYVAAYVADVFDLEDGIRLIAERGRLIEEVASGGATVAVLAAPARVAELIAPYAEAVSIAAINGPETTLIAGVSASIERAVEACRAAGVEVRPLQIPHAPHSPLMEPALDRFEHSAGELTYRRPRIALISNVTGGLVHSVDAGYWRRHIREPVRFSSGVRQLEAQGCRVMIEVGPQPVLLWLSRQNWQGAGGVCWLPSIWNIRSDRDQMLESAAEAYVNGVSLDWPRLLPGRRTRVDLPTYPFQRRRFWVSAPPNWRRATGDGSDPGHPLLGQRVYSPALPADRTVFESRLGADTPRMLGDHRVQGRPVLPAAACLEMVIEAARATRAGPLGMTHAVFSRMLALPDVGTRRVQCVLTDGPSGRSWQLYSAPETPNAPTWTLHAEGALHDVQPDDTPSLDLAGRAEAHGQAMPVDALYEQLRAQGLDYGPAFRAIRALWRRDDAAIGRIVCPGRASLTVALDGCFQVAAALFVDRAETHVPVGIERLDILGPMDGELWCEARIRESGPAATQIDLRVTDADGAVVARIIGLQVQPSNGDPPEAQSPETQWLYDIEWRAQPLLRAQGAVGRRWLIFGDARGPGGELSERLRAGGHAVTVVAPDSAGLQPGDGTWVVDSDAPDAFRRGFAACPEPDGIVYCWGIDDGQRQGPDTTQQVPARAAQRCTRLLALVQSMADLPDPPRLWVVTRGAAVGASPAGEAFGDLIGAPQWGMAKAVALEHPEWRCVSVDLDPATALALSGDALFAEVTDGWDAPADEVVIRSGTRRVARLVRARVGHGEAPMRVTIRRKGSLDALELVPADLRPPGPDEVVIRVGATGINFRDVLNALGLYPGDAGSLGNECAGVVTAVGSAVEAFAVGDAVLALVEDGFAHRVTVAANRVVRAPAGLSAMEAATIPIAFLTAAYCLDQLCRIAPGDRVLIHTATGGFGQAAVQIARAAGAEVFATASRGKWSTLEEMGIHHIYDSRTTGFGDGILADTGGRGVDIVLNTLTSPGFVEANLGVLAPDGRFIEVSKRDVWDAEQIGAVRSDVEYVLVDLAAMTRQDPEAVRPMLSDLVARFPETLRPIPHTAFALHEIEAAFRHMQQAKHVGKLVIVPERADAIVRSDGWYLITGGLGALGLLVARALVEDGARSVALMGRSPPGARAREVIGALEALGAEVAVVRGDVSVYADVVGALAALGSDRPLRGVVHAAGVLEDGTLLNQTPDQFAKVLAPKINGGWNLHLATRDAPLDIFVLFSSVASMLGSAGQANHTAANTFLDALAHHRRRRGQPACSINWGAWSEIGAAAALVDQMARKGMGAIPPDRGHRLFSGLLRSRPTQVGVIPIDWTGYRAERALFEDFRSTDRAPAPMTLAERLAAQPPMQRRAALAEYIQEQVAQILGHHADRVDRGDAFRALGMDSLTSLELRNRLQLGLGRRLPAGIVFDHPTVEALTDRLLDAFIDAADAESAEPAAPSTVPAEASDTRERHITVGGIALCLCEWGAAGGPTIVCLHGTRDHAGSWAAVAERLTDRSRALRIVAPDLRGHGRSDHAPAGAGYHYLDFVSDLEGLLDAVAPGPVTLVAHSLGTFIASAYAAAHPDRVNALVLVEPPLPPTGRGDPSPAPSTRYTHAAMADLDVAAERLQMASPTLSLEAARQAAGRLTHPIEQGVVWRWDPRLNAPFQHMLDGLSREEHLAEMTRSSVPTTTIFGDRSGWVTPADRARILAAAPHARVSLLEGGHNLHLEAALGVAEVIARVVGS